MLGAFATIACIVAYMGGDAEGRHTRQFLKNCCVTRSGLEREGRERRLDVPLSERTVTGEGGNHGGRNSKRHRIGAKDDNEQMSVRSDNAAAICGP